jgi:hypothetical protein
MYANRTRARPHVSDDSTMRDMTRETCNLRVSVLHVGVSQMRLSYKVDGVPKPRSEAHPARCIAQCGKAPPLRYIKCVGGAVETNKGRPPLYLLGGGRLVPRGIRVVRHVARCPHHDGSYSPPCNGARLEETHDGHVVPQHFSAFVSGFVPVPGGCLTSVAKLTRWRSRSAWHVGGWPTRMGQWQSTGCDPSGAVTDMGASGWPKLTVFSDGKL